MKAPVCGEDGRGGWRGLDTARTTLTALLEQDFTVFPSLWAGIQTCAQTAGCAPLRGRASARFCEPVPELQNLTTDLFLLKDTGLLTQVWVCARISTGDLLGLELFSLPAPFFFASSGSGSGLWSRAHGWDRPAFNPERDYLGITGVRAPSVHPVSPFSGFWMRLLALHCQSTCT